jgi:hypothetical protein
MAAGGGGIALRVIMSRSLDKPEADVGSQDSEQLFDALTERGAADERLVLIIGDAELLLSDAIAYLRLLAIKHQSAIIDLPSPAILS